MLKLEAQLQWQLGFAKFSSQRAGPCLNWLLLGWASTTRYVTPAKCIEKENWIWHSPISWEHHLHESYWFLCLSPSPTHILSLGSMEKLRSFLAMAVEKRIRKNVGSYLVCTRRRLSRALVMQFCAVCILFSEHFRHSFQKRGTILVVRNKNRSWMTPCHI